MNRTLTYQQVAAIFAILLNILVVAPASWVLNYLWDQELEFERDTKEKHQALKNEIEQLRIDLITDYMTRQSFDDYRKDINQRILHLDYKLIKNQRLSGSVE